MASSSAGDTFYVNLGAQPVFILAEADADLCKAALRLLYYFPTESAKLIADRIRGFDLGRSGDVHDLIQRYHRNGVAPWRFGMDGELRLRVCDRAAMTLSRLLPGVKFTTPPRFEDRDREIVAIAAKLRGHLQAAPAR